MPGPVTDTDPDTHPYAYTDAERVTNQGANMDRIPNDILRPVYHAVNAWWCSVYDSDRERDSERDILSACRALLAYVDGEQQRDSDAEPDPEPERALDADEPDPEWVTELVAHVRRAADAAERIAERVCYPQREPDSEFGFVDNIHRAYRLGWDAGEAAAKHRSQ